MAAMAAVSLLDTRNLCKSFGGLQAVRSVDFNIREGEIRGIIGPNGAGKTTFVNLLSGRVAPTDGSIRFRGREISAMPAWQRVRLGIAYTFQVTSVYPALSVYDNVAIAAQNQVLQQSAGVGHEPGLIREAVEHCLEQVGLAGIATDRVGEIAYGHQRLLEISMGLALQPSLLILDEPTQGLSDSEIEKFARLIEKIRQRTTVLLIEHNMPLVMSLADSITVLDQGAVLACGSPAEIQARSDVQAAYLGG
jgi:branched-chain amino acid transport system ATP-binding protein